MAGEQHVAPVMPGADPLQRCGGPPLDIGQRLAPGEAHAPGIVAPALLQAGVAAAERSGASALPEAVAELP